MKNIKNANKNEEKMKGGKMEELFITSYGTNFHFRLFWFENRLAELQQ